MMVCPCMVCLQVISGLVKFVPKDKMENRMVVSAHTHVYLLR